MKRSRLVPLSPAQREIMDIIWDRGEMTATEVRNILAKRRSVARNTVRTIIMRMENKGWLTHRDVGRTFLYSAVLPREATIGQRVVEVVDTVCGGSAKTLMTALLDYRGLTKTEVVGIRAMINQPKRKKAGGRKRKI